MFLTQSGLPFLYFLPIGTDINTAVKNWCCYKFPLFLGRYLKNRNNKKLGDYGQRNDTLYQYLQELFLKFLKRV